jgi:hypothetical protein
MNKEFVPYEESLALKELGFDEECLKYWNDFGKTSTYMRFQLLNDIDDWCQDYIKAPLYSQAFRWFREKHNLYQYIEPSFDCIKLGYQNYSWLIKLRERVFIKNGTFKTYEEAELDCLKKLIEIVKNK